MEFIIFIIGLVFGSFLNVCIYRLPKKESIIFPPSSCSHCNHKLKPIDLIPVFSFMFLRGKCRYCNEKLSKQYPVIELITGIIFVIIYQKIGFNLYFLKAICLVSIVIVMSIIDYRHFIIPDKLSIFTLASAIFFNILIRDIPIKSLVLAFLVGGGFLFLIALIGPMGGGDIKIMAGFSLYLGIERTIAALLIAFILAGIIGIILIALKIKDRKDYIPFGPFLGGASAITFLYFNEILNWYINLL
ncbi:MAG: prepilin peptidase [Bacillota bacterium]